MTPIRVLSVCVGVSTYPVSVLEPGERPLKYLAKGAQDLKDLFASMWPSATSAHEVLINEAATLARTRSAFTSAPGPFDLRILYLAGHGRGGAGRPYQFLFHGGEPRDAAVTTQDLDTLLEGAGGDAVLLLLDSCSAGAFAGQSRFFSSEHFQRARICVASCGESQKSWEDDYFQQSLFCHAIIQTLTVDPGESGKSIALTGEVFAQIASAVSHHAFALKASTAQEPVARAMVADVIMLTPTKSTRALRASMTTYQVLVRRSRQVLVMVAVIAVVFVVGLSMTTWRPAFNEHGYVELRAGPKWLSPLNVGPWKRRVETLLVAADLRDKDLAAGVADEAGLHNWLGSNSAGLRRWSSVAVEEYLNDRVAAAWSIRLGLEGAVERLTTTVPVGGGGGLRPPRVAPERVSTVDIATELAAEAKLLEPQHGLSDVWTLQWSANFVEGTCDESAISSQTTDRLRSYISLTEPAAFSRWLRGVALSARTDDAITLAHVAQLVEMFRAANVVWRQDYTNTVGAPGEPITAERVASRFTERPSREEQLALRDVTSAVLERRLALGRTPVTNQERVRLSSLGSGCTDYLAPILAALGADGDVPRVLGWSRARKTADQGRTALSDLALRGVLPDEEVVHVLLIQGFDADAASRKRSFVSTHEWLGRIADVRGLPVDLMHRLLDYADERLKLGDAAGVRDVLAVVSRSHTVSEPKVVARVQSLIAEAVQPRPPLPPGDFEVELLGLLARSGAPLTDRQRESLFDIVRAGQGGDIPRVTFTESDRAAGSKTTRLVSGLTSAHLLAQSRAILAQGAWQPPLDEAQSLFFLRTALIDSVREGANQNRFQEVVAAAALLVSRQKLESSAAKGIRQDLVFCSGDAAARQIEVNMAVARIAMLPSAQMAPLLDELRALWRREHEPEVRLALAEIVVRAVSERSTWIRAARPRR